MTDMNDHEVPRLSSPMKIGLDKMIVTLHAIHEHLLHIIVIYYEHFTVFIIVTSDGVLYAIGLCVKTRPVLACVFEQKRVF